VLAQEVEIYLTILKEIRKAVTRSDVHARPNACRRRGPGPARAPPPLPAVHVAGQRAQRRAGRPATPHRVIPSSSVMRGSSWVSTTLSAASASSCPSRAPAWRCGSPGGPAGLGLAGSRRAGHHLQRQIAPVAAPVRGRGRRRPIRAPPPSRCRRRGVPAPRRRARGRRRAARCRWQRRSRWSSRTGDRTAPRAPAPPVS
jgi:hypothetical protein